jgi:hypothetical protein
VDYRKLNDLTIKNRFPMPLVEEILEELAGTRYFTSLDLTAGYHQIRMGEGEEFKTAFKTHRDIISSELCLLGSLMPLLHFNAL